MDKELAELERRVSHLEGELETSYEQEKFENGVGSMFPDDASLDFKDGHYGYFARATDITGDDVNIALEKADRYGYETAVVETGEGLGMEVWLEPNVGGRNI